MKNEKWKMKNEKKFKLILKNSYSLKVKQDTVNIFMGVLLTLGAINFI